MVTVVTPSRWKPARVCAVVLAAPSSTVDNATARGEDIVIEERDGDEVRRGFGVLTAPADARVYSPAFDVTPAKLISAIITDRGVMTPPNLEV